MLTINDNRVMSAFIGLVLFVVLQYYTVCSMYLKLQSFTYQLSSDHNKLVRAHENLHSKLHDIFSTWEEN